MPTEMGSQQFDTPHGCPITSPQGILVEMLEDMGGRQLRCRYRPAAPGGIGQGRGLVTRQIALEPVINRLRTHARQCRHLTDRLPLGDPQDSLDALKETHLGYPLERFCQARDIVSVESQFG